MRKAAYRREKVINQKRSEYIMLVANRERRRYQDTAKDYRVENRYPDNFYRSDEYAEYNRESENTSEERRERLLAALENCGGRIPAKSEAEYDDERRYSRYAYSRVSASEEADNNYDRMYDARHRGFSGGEVAGKKILDKKKVPFMLAYLIIAIIAVSAVLISVIGVNSANLVLNSPVGANAAISANAETGGASAAVEENSPSYGVNYAMREDGSIVAVTLTDIAENTEENTNWFDKLCDWVNGVIGG